MGNHSNYRGVAVIQVGFDKQGRVTGADAKSGYPLAVSHLMAALSKWRFNPVVVDGARRQGCGTLVIKFSVRDNAPAVEVLKQLPADERSSSNPNR